MNKIILFIFFLIPTISMAHTNNDREYFLQKEYYDFIMSESDERIEKYIQEGIIYKKEDAKFFTIQHILEEICEYYQKKCVSLYLTKEVIEAAAMYPNGVLVLNENVANKLNKDELTFLLAHEFGHYYYNHSLKKSHVFAHIIIEQGVFIIDVERTIKMAFALPGMKDSHHEIEQQADELAIDYLKNKNVKIDCYQFFDKVVAKEKVSTEQHKPIKDRCNLFKK